MIPCIRPAYSRCSVNAYGWKDGWLMDRWMDGWMDVYTTILSFPSLLWTTCFYQSQSLQWQLLSAAAHKRPTLLRQQWKMISGAVQMMVREHSGISINIKREDGHHLQKEPRCSTKASATPSADGYWVPGCEALLCPHWWWSNKNPLGLGQKGHRLWN